MPSFGVKKGVQKMGHFGTPKSGICLEIRAISGVVVQKGSKGVKSGCKKESKMSLKVSRKAIITRQKAIKRGQKKGQKWLQKGQKGSKVAAKKGQK